ncbi:O-antigen ligase family protein [Acinetobacter sp. KS-LM10]|uniref:O-antigen ligase family protein n=1 Tax=Acinetobacter sp. KS-LM10 TaxID=3120518 RepID=UPI0030D5C4D7
MRLFIFFSIIFLILAWLLPFHRSPWPTFGSEVLTFISASILLFGFYKTKISIPKPQLLILPIVFVPLLQLLFGQGIYFSNAILCTGYILMFWCMVVVGFNLSDTPEKREKIFKLFSFALLVVGLVSSWIAIFQWLNLNSYFSTWMYTFKGNRPYANLAQPNNLATLLTISLLACLYFYEKRIIKNVYLIPYSIILLFSIALTQSRTTWVVCLFILLYLPIKQWRAPARFSTLKLLSWIAVFVLFIGFLPAINSWVALVLNHNMVETASVIERASSGYLRLDMWQQQWVALMQQPWFGYGWNQTGIAQIAAFDAHPSHEWYKSAHNIVFDLLIWNGVIIGGLMIVYFSAWLYWLNKGVKDTISIVAMLMVCAILIHGMLEFPLHYAYFLLPAGFLLGIVQSQYQRLPAVKVSGKSFVVITIFIIIGSAVSVRDYFLYKEQSVIAGKTTPLTESQQLVMNKEIILLTQFEERVWWIQLNPKTHFNSAELAYLDTMVANMASKYDLYKYAQVLAFNGYKAKAEHQLWILETLHGEKSHYEDLLK